MIEYFRKNDKGTAQTRVHEEIFLNAVIPFSKEKLFQYNNYLNPELKKFNELKKQVDEVKEKINNILLEKLIS
ncbi:hypothetical protein [Candidatus Phytoplasma ziziphi]|uniref:hypothetical protein n=1 Tax='Prunus avium' virescence phytoplasma TaxID=2056121 RepID=UPI00126011FC